MWYIIGIGAIVAAIAGAGVVISRRERANAPERLAEARAFFEEGELNKALAKLDQAFYVPLDETYEAEDASVALEAVELLDQIFEEMNVDGSDMTAPLLDKLRSAADGGGEVRDRFTQPVDRFLDKTYGDAELANDLIDKLKAGEIDVLVNDDQPETAMDRTSDGLNSVINQVGQYLLEGDTDAAIAMLDRHLDEVEGEDRVPLLNQRGGAYFMAGDHESALADYRTCADLDPQNAMHFANAAEAAEKLGDKGAARELAEEALDLGTDSDASHTAREVLERLG